MSTPPLDIPAEVNPPAFPQHKWIRESIHSLSGAWVSYGGMTLQDYFAGQLASSILGAPSKTAPSLPAMAKACYDMADAMLAQRRARRQDDTAGEVGP